MEDVIHRVQWYVITFIATVNADAYCQIITAIANNDINEIK